MCCWEAEGFFQGPRRAITRIRAPPKLLDPPPKINFLLLSARDGGYPTHDTGLTHSHGSCGSAESSLFQTCPETTKPPSGGQMLSTGPIWPKEGSTGSPEEMAEGSGHRREPSLSSGVCLQGSERRQQLRKVPCYLADPQHCALLS